MKKNLFLLVMLLAGPFAPALFAQPPGGLAAAAKVVGEGTVSTRDVEFNFTVSADSSVSFFTKALLPDWRRMSIVYARRKGGKWQEPRLAPFSGQYRDADPFLSPDQSQLVFISDRPSKYQQHPAAYTLWTVAPPFLGKAEPEQLEGDFYGTLSPLYPSLSLNGNLYFSASTGKDSDIYFVRKEKGRYGQAVKLPFNSAQSRDLDPVIAPDESFLIFTSTSRAGFGGADLYVSFQNGGTWSEPVNLGGNVNTFLNEGQPGLSADGRSLYFSSIKPKDKADYSPRQKRLSNAALEKELNSPFNGLPNIWKINIASIQDLNGYAQKRSN